MRAGRRTKTIRIRNLTCRLVWLVSGFLGEIAGSAKLHAEFPDGMRQLCLIGSGLLCILVGAVAGGYFIFAAIQNAMMSMSAGAARADYAFAAWLFIALAMFFSIGCFALGIFLFKRSSKIDGE